MVVVANQHGDEFTVSNSAVELVRALTSSAAGAKEIRRAVTLTVIPRVNIDGFDATPTGEPWRQNVDPDFCTLAPCPAFYAVGRGFDINRHHSYLVSDPRDDPNTGPVGVGQGDNPVPESLAVRAEYDAAGGAAGVAVVMDLHHQGSKTDAEGQMVTGSTLWPNATATADALGIRPQFDQVVLRSKQVVSTLGEAVHRYGYANFSKYCGTTPPGISRNAYEEFLAGRYDGARWELRSSFTRGYNVLTLGHHIVEPRLDDAAAVADFVAEKDRAHSRLAGVRVTHTVRVVDGRKGYVWNHGGRHGVWYYAAWFPQPVHSVRVECIARREASRFRRLCAEAMDSLGFR